MFSDLGTEPLAAWSKLPDAGKAQIITAIFCVEFAGEFAKPHYTKGGPMPPQFDPLGFGKNLTPEQMKNKQIKELKNGRLAMVGIMSFFAAATKVGSVPFFMFLIGQPRVPRFAHADGSPRAAPLTRSGFLCAFGVACPLEFARRAHTRSTAGGGAGAGSLVRVGEFEMPEIPYSLALSPPHLFFLLSRSSSVCGGGGIGS